MSARPTPYNALIRLLRIDQENDFPPYDEIVSDAKSVETDLLLRSAKFIGEVKQDLILAARAA